MARISTSVRTRIILTYLAIFLVSATVMTGLAGWFYSQSALRNAYANLEAQAFVAASALERPLVLVESYGRTRSLGDLEVLVQRFAQSSNSQISVVDNQGNVLLTSLPETPPNQGAYPEIETALSGQLGHHVRWDSVSRRPTVYAAAPVRRLGRPLFVVQISMPLMEVTRQTQQFWLVLGGTVLLAALAVALAGWWLAEQLARPVRRLSDAAAEVAAGCLDERVPEEEMGGITEMAQLAHAFNNMATRVQEMIQRQRAFVANASHELRTPVTNIRLRAEALATGALEDPQVAHRFADEIEREADRLGRLAGDLLTLSRQDAAPAPVREEVDVVAVAREVVSDMTLRAQKSGVTLVTDFASDVTPIRADPAGIRGILLNLLDNALQYTNSGGQVTVHLRNDGQNLLLEVADTGVGIPPEDLPHIFERFYRVDRARSRRTAIAGSGAGLGLAIVEGIVTEHGGTVSAQSELHRGTRITVRLPRRQE